MNRSLNLQIAGHRVGHGVEVPQLTRGGGGPQSLPVTANRSSYVHYIIEDISSAASLVVSVAWLTESDASEKSINKQQTFALRIS